MLCYYQVAPSIFSFLPQPQGGWIKWFPSRVFGEKWFVGRSAALPHGVKPLPAANEQYQGSTGLNSLPSF